MGVTPTSAAGFYQMFQDKNDLTWSGSDQFTSYKANGFQYWLFGDTILGTENAAGGYDGGWTMIGNSILLQQGDLLVPALASGSSLAVPDPATRDSSNLERYWTQGMFAANGFVYVLAQRVRNTSSGFEIVGGELAKFSQDATTGKLTFKSMIVLPSTGQPEVPGPKGIQWCSDAVVSAGGYVYIFGATRAEGNPYVIHFSYVMRVPTASVENVSAWRFYKASTGTWVDKIDQLDQDVVNQPDAIFASQASSVRWINSKWVEIDKPWNGWGVDVKIRTASTPMGPWTEATLFQSPEGTFEGLPYETYAPQLHPEFPLGSGKVLVSIARNFKNGDLPTIGSNADLYKAEFYEFTI